MKEFMGNGQPKAQRGTYTGLASSHAGAPSVGYRVCIGDWDDGKETGNYYIIIGYVLGLYWDIGKEHGNYYVGFRRRTKRLGA